MTSSDKTAAGLTLNAHKFITLSQQLAATEALWRPLAFRSIELPWQNEFPKLCERLNGLSLTESEQLQSDSMALTNWLRADLPIVTDLFNLCLLPKASTIELQEYPHGFERDIPGRKWQQVQAFISTMHDTMLPLLEWCGGKGHLARSACLQIKCSGVSIDINPKLIEQGQEYSARFNLPLQHHVADALTTNASQWLQPQQHAIALHACGGLHLALIERAITAKTQALSIAPCCYHLFNGEQNSSDSNKPNYQVQSVLAQAHDLHLSQSDLRTCVQQTVTAPEHDRRTRKTLQASRLGFDLLQRHIRKQDDYLAVPSLANHWASTSFKSICVHIAALKQLSLANISDDDFNHYEKMGLQRLKQVSAYDLVRMAFRRPLELWLVLDRALKLEEAGYRVEISEFCQEALTPRNILISAQRQQ